MPICRCRAASLSRNTLRWSVSAVVSSMGWRGRNSLRYSPHLKGRKFAAQKPRQRGMKTSTPLPKDWREGRRLRAWKWYEQGWPQRKIAEALGVERWSGESMDQSWQRARTGSVAPSSLAWCAAQAVAGAARPVARTGGQRSRSVGVPGPSLDRRAGGVGHQTRVWRELSSNPLQSPPQSAQTPRPETGKPSQPTGCTGDPDLA